MEPLRGPRDRDLGGAFQYSRRLTRLMDKPLWGLRVQAPLGAVGIGTRTWVVLSRIPEG